MSEPKFWRVMIAESTERGGEKRTYWHEVGRAWERVSADTGERFFSVRIFPGVSIAGEVRIFAATERAEQPETTAAPSVAKTQPREQQKGGRK